MAVMPFLVYFCVYIISCHGAEQTSETQTTKPQFVPPALPHNPYAVMFFTSPSDLHKLLTISAAKKDNTDEAIAKYDGVWSVEVPKSSAIDLDYALVLKSKAKHHAIASKLRRPITFDTNEIVIQYEVKFEDGIDCAGAYIKLLSASDDLKLELFNDKTPYTIMFGPDKCGMDHKYHFIIRYKNPKSGQFEEKHAKKLSSDIDSYFTDGKTHLYTLVLRSDNTFVRYIDEKKVQSGSLLLDLEPPINPPMEIDDPNDERPADWDEREKVIDPNAKKPDDWDENEPESIIDESATKPVGWLDDEPEMIADPSAVQPSDWDPEMDGDWEAPQIKNPKCDSAPGCGEWTKPQIPNPKYKGKWSPPLVANPAYKGKWQPAKIPNPNFFEDKQPFRSLTKVSALGLELWSMNENIVFDNFLIVDSAQEASAFAAKTWKVKQQAEQVADPNARSVVDAIRENVVEKPWLSLFIGLACSLPVLFCCIYMCRSPKSTAAAAHYKKTDSPTPDDNDVEGEPNEDEAEEGVVEDEDNEEEDEEEEEKDESSTEDDVVDVAAGGDSSHIEGKGVVSGKVEQETDSADEPAAVHVTEKHTTRKRRSRKE